jgi:hypothetical protein
MLMSTYFHKMHVTVRVCDEENVNVSQSVAMDDRERMVANGHE